jgi:hypothetical protein
MTTRAAELLLGQLDDAALVLPQRRPERHR